MGLEVRINYYRKNTAILDVDVYFGMYTLLSAILMHGTGNVYAFEPILPPSMYYEIM